MGRRRPRLPIELFGLKAIAKAKGLRLWQADGIYRVVHRDGQLLLETPSLIEVKRLVTSHAAVAA